MQLQLQKLCGDAAEMLSTVKAQTEQAKRLTGRLLKHVKSSEAQLAESRDAMTSLRQEAQTANNRLQATM